MLELIDANALLKKCIEGDGDDEFTEGYNFAVQEISAKIMLAPKIEVEPVRYGRWIEKPPYVDETVKGLEFQIVCSRCDEQNASINFNDDGEIIGKTFYKTKFCPNCGADMRKDGKDNV